MYEYTMVQQKKIRLWLGSSGHLAGMDNDYYMGIIGYIFYQIITIKQTSASRRNFTMVRCSGGANTFAYNGMLYNKR